MGCPLFWGGGESSESLHRFSALASEDSRAFLKVASPLWDRKRREKKKHSFECERFFAFMIPPQHKVRAVNKVIDEMGLLEKVKVEWGLLCMAHNISKLANIQWV